MQENSTLRELIERIAIEEGADFKKLLLDTTTNKPLPNVSILVNGRHNRFVGGLETRLKEGDIVDVLSAMSGG
jgi:molybdopterin converting factor small subunit